jgi:hypothetical protein
VKKEKKPIIVNVSSGAVLGKKFNDLSFQTKRVRQKRSDKTVSCSLAEFARIQRVLNSCESSYGSIGGIVRFLTRYCKRVGIRLAIRLGIRLAIGLGSNRSARLQATPFLVASPVANLHHQS